jgi:hypothetical protein
MDDSKAVFPNASPERDVAQAKRQLAKIMAATSYCERSFYHRGSIFATIYGANKN